MNNKPDPKIKRFSKKTQIEGFKESTFRQRTALETIQRPTVLFPAAVCISSNVYLLLLSPMFGGTPVAVGISILSGISAIALFFYGFNKIYPQKTRELIRQHEEWLVQQEANELKRICLTLQAGFFSIAAHETIFTLTGLAEEYQQLQLALAGSKVNDPLAVSLIPALAKETFRRGLSVLEDAHEMMKALYTPLSNEPLKEFSEVQDSPNRIDPTPVGQRERLTREINALEKEIAAYRVKQGHTERFRLKEMILADRRERLQMIDRLELAAENLVYQAQRCQISLQSTRLELAGVRASSSSMSVNSVVNALRDTIREVKEVQDEFKKLNERAGSQNNIEKEV
jgi:hypothetical protein